MSGRAVGLRQGLPMALVAAATTWIGMWSWKGFTTSWGAFLGPLIVVAAFVSVGGALLRAAPIPRRAGVALHVLAIVVLLWVMLGGSPISPFASTRDIAQNISDAWVSASTWAPPIPTTVPSIAPLMIPCGALALFLVDLTACWLRRVSLAGLPLLAVYCVPISLIGTGVSWLVFLVAATGFLLMMFLQESAHISRWGRPLGTSAAGADPHGFGVSTGASRTSASTVGSAAVVLAVILPIFIPTLHLDGLGMFGAGGSGGSGVKVVNPITDMRRNLQRGKDVALLDIKTDDPNPSYLRIAVLTQFTGVEWTTGSRQIISDQVADGIVPLEQGLFNDVPLTSYNYSVQATSDFDSRWLPTQFPVSDIEAAGDWHWDASTMDFIAGPGQPTTAGASWTMTSSRPKLSPSAMEHSLQAPLAIQTAYTGYPSTLPPLVQDLAERHTAGDTTRFQRAVDLQRWFRSTGHFRYSLNTNPGDGNNALLTFLTRGKGGRVGYCEQFASAFAVMARTLQIPARVAVGFLQPTQGANGDWVYSAHDLHAWPELYFHGSGWVRFEPTPASRAGTTPVYTRESDVKTGGPKKTQGPEGGRISSEPTATNSVARPSDLSTSSGSSDSGFQVPWVQLLIGVVVLILLGLLALLPRSIRRSRRTKRLAGTAEDAWAELRDSAVDLGVGWSAGRSPHDTGSQLVGWFGAEPDGPPPVRPARGRGLAPGAEDALDRIVRALERVRYARFSDDVPGALADDVRTCIAALEHGSTRRALRRAQWMPRSVFVRGGGSSAQSARERQSEVVAAGGVVDHVG
jgi:transglutaminase-like putative cysteine protease